MGRIRLTATFLDEISTDIPHQNWGPKEWDADFAAMKHIGIDTVVMIRCGLERFITYPSEILMRERQCFRPPVDLMELFLTLAEKHGMRFMVGTYVGQMRWNNEDEIDYEKETDLDCRIASEIWEKYGKHSPAFAGWYLAKEIETLKEKVVTEFVELGSHCKKISGNLPVMISPSIRAKHSYPANDPRFNRGMDFERHERDWNIIMERIKGIVDIIAFQDGNCTLDELPRALAINRKLADKYGIDLWTNTESFDRDMPFKFPPIKWEKMRLKLKIAEEAGIDKAMTFEFSHFMSPNSFWHSAHHLYNRYCDYLNESE